MPNELYIYDGFITDGSGTITGSLNVARGITGSLFGTASQAVTASYALSAGLFIDTIPTASVDSFAVLMVDPVTKTLYTQPSVQYNAASGSISTTVASSSNVIFGPYNEPGVVPLETGYSVVITPYGESGGLEAPNTLFYDGNARTLTVTSSFATSASFASTASYVLNAVSASFATNSATASYVLNAISASRASTASYVLNAVSASFASTASFVNTLNQNVLITGSLTVGATTLGANENTLVIGPAPAGGTGEGGQILLQAPGGTYTSASMFDNYQNYTRILRGTNAGSDALVAQWNMHTKQMSLPAYNSTSAFSGTVVGLLAFDSSGNVITTTTGSGGGGGGSGTVNSGVAGYLAYYPGTGTTVDDTSGVYWDAGNSRLAVGNAAPAYKLDVSGDVRATGAVYANANGAMYFRGGDDAELWDINVANTVGIYGQQDQGVASVKLGSGGGTISGRSGSIGINQTAPTSRLHINFDQTGSTQNDANGILLANSTAATANTQSISPGIVFQGNGWRTTNTGSQDVRFRIDMLPVQSSTNPLGGLQIASSISGSAYTNLFTFNSDRSLVGSNLSSVVSTGILATQQLQAIGAGTYSAVSYRTTNAGADVSTPAFVAGASSAAAGQKTLFYDTSNGLVFVAGNAGSNRIARASIDITNLTNTAGAETGDLTFSTKPSTGAMTARMTISASGNIGINQTTPTSRLHLNANQNSETQNDANGILLANSTAATNGVQSISPPLIIQGNGFATTTSTSQDVRYRIDVLPVQGSSQPTSTFQIGSSISGSAYTNLFVLRSSGRVEITNDLVVGGGHVHCNSQISAIGYNLTDYMAASVYTTNAGGSSTPQFIAGTKTLAAGFRTISIDQGALGLMFNAANGTNRICRAAIYITNLNNTAGAETGDLILQTQSGGTAATTKMLISGSGAVRILSGSLTVLSNVFATSGVGTGGQIQGLSTATAFTIQQPQFVNGGPVETVQMAFGSADTTAGRKLLTYNADYGLMFSARSTGAVSIIRAAIDIANLNNTAGSETGDLILQTQSGGTAMTTKMLISGSGNVSILSGSLGVGIRNPNSGSIHVNGGVFATSFTGSLFGTATTASFALNASSSIVSSNSANASQFVTFTAATGSNAPLLANSNIRYNPSTSTLTVPNISGSAITASFINGGTDLIDLSNASGITISTTGSGFVNINTGLAGTVRISSPLIVTGSILSLDNITAYSDESVKSNVTTIPNALNKVLEMRGVTYTRTDLQDTERIHAGVIAQELENAFPEVVYELPNGKKTVAYGNITSILIEAIKEQQKQIDDLRKQIEKLS